ncbi:MAG: sulfatase [Alphaproteobacteria bacterium]|nr:sulfatase [Alphaproteobacteria bacterium]
MFPFATNPSKSADRPLNILFLLADDQRNDTLGCYGHPFIQTPAIDALAAHGTLFENAFVTTSICPVSRATILTGLYETTHGFTFGKPPLEDRFLDLSYPRVLREAGYRTGFIGKYGIEASEQAPSRLFDRFVPLFRQPYFRPDGDGRLRHVTDLTADAAVDFLESVGAQPFCLSVSFNAAHAEDTDLENHFPWPPSVDSLYETIRMPPPALSDPAFFNSLPDFMKESMNRKRFYWRWDTPEKYQRNLKGYFRMISGIDRAVQRMVATLGAIGLLDNTLIVYTADNGYYMADRGFAGKWSHFEQSLRVPMIVVDPRVSLALRGQRRSEIALNVDLPAMMLDACGIAVPEHYQGESLLPLVHGASVPDWRDGFFCEHRMEHPDIPEWEGLRGVRHVYARYVDQSPVYEFLHDLEADPNQLRNVAGDSSHEEVLMELRARTDQLKAGFEADRALI